MSKRILVVEDQKDNRQIMTPHSKRGKTTLFSPRSVTVVPVAHAASVMQSRSKGWAFHQPRSSRLSS
jgi:CheY-like chemotaxis protein